MTYGVRQVAVSTTPVVVLAASSFHGVKANLKNAATAVFIGGPDLTSANTATKGQQIAASGTYDLELGAGEKAYVVTASGTSTVTVAGGGA